jgi:hypothetical protein
MAKYRRKPIIYEASQWTRLGEHPHVTAYGSTVGVERHEYHQGCGALYIDHGLVHSLEGSHIVCPGDWILTGLQGEHWAVKPDIFALTYELVE